MNIGLERDVAHSVLFCEHVWLYDGLQLGSVRFCCFGWMMYTCMLCYVLVKNVHT